MPKGSKSLATITAPIFCSEIILATSETCVERRTVSTGALAIDPPSLLICRKRVRLFGSRQANRQIAVSQSA